ARKERFRKRIREFMAEKVDRQELAAWLQSARTFLAQHPTGWVTPKPISGGRSSTNISDDNVILFSARRGASNDFQLKPGAGTWTSLRLDLVPDETHAGKILRDKAENRPIQVSVKSKQGKIEFFLADATHKEATYSNGSENVGVEDGWKPDSDHLKSEQTAVYVFKKPVTLKEDESLTVTIRSSSIGAARVSLSPFGAPQPLTLLNSWAQLGDALAAEIFLLSSDHHRDLARERQKLQRELLECRNGRSPTLVTVSWEPMLTRVLPRGNWQDESGEIVNPDIPNFLKQEQPDHQKRQRTAALQHASVTPTGFGLRQSSAAFESPTRLDLTRWLVSSDNPLTARTFVNRLWKQFFGAGLCTTVDDLGSQGDTPSHPELLDWLAVEFQDNGWDIKHIVRLIVNSSTYRQSSQLRPELRDLDPNNRLLASQNPRRIEAEFVRDNALCIAGLLDDDLGGPSVHPYQPAHYYDNLQFPDRDYVPDTDEREYRRGVYVHWQRTFLQPMLANFDAPSREECTVARVVSNTPQQALTLLNDPSFVEAASAFANRLKGSDSERIDMAYLFALGRQAKPKEKQSLLSFLEAQRKTGSNTEAWTSLCRVILNLHETITIY
ncbi:MAG TPA: DUF1553 domain-containing protein, partial [Verrucomicrobiae bacterium]|nr:DUF1553 domain-containing protein [Verrucomicrobiae bacterium]